MLLPQTRHAWCQVVPELSRLHAAGPALLEPVDHRQGYFDHHLGRSSVTPITSLASSLYDIVNAQTTEIGPAQLKKKLVLGLGAVRERSSGLIKFTTAYQDIAKIPPPVIETVQTTDLINRLQSLFSAEMKDKGIDFFINMEDAPDSFLADINLFEQVIINLIRNAQDAVMQIEKPAIQLIVNPRAGRQVSLQVQDNGPGIPEDILDRIFVPFFSTK